MVNPITSNKEVLFHSHWSKIFRNDQNDEDFDQENVELVTNNTTVNSDSLHPFPYSNINIIDPSFPPITTREFNKIIHQRKHKSPGPSGITAHDLQHLPFPANMISHLAFIYNLRLCLGYFPKSLKHAIMIFIPKSTLSQHHVQNHRPISLLEIHGKILDKILETRLNHHLALHDLEYWFVLRFYTMN